MTDYPATALKHILHQEGRLRVWSIIVTILGEVAEPMGGQMAVSELIDICHLLDIEPQAVRTALSRLSKEGWVKSHKNGRGAVYHFTQDSRKIVQEASIHVYKRPSVRQPDDWVYAILPAQGAQMRAKRLEDMKALHPLALTNQLITWPAKQMTELSPALKASLILFDKPPISLPDTLLDTLAPTPHHELCQRLAEICEMTATADLTPQKMLAVRVLLIHFWRRLVLRFPPINAPLPETLWPLPILHRQMAKHYHLITQKSQAALSSALSSAYDERVLQARFR